VNGCTFHVRVKVLFFLVRKRDHSVFCFEEGRLMDGLTLFAIGPWALIIFSASSLVVFFSFAVLPFVVWCASVIRLSVEIRSG